jgi:putrescine transport system substrate-binding protein
VKLCRALAALLLFAAMPAQAGEPSPFAPPPIEKPRRVRVLAFANYFEAQTLAEFERAGNVQVAYDSYEAPEAIQEKLRDGPYDLLIMPGPELAREIAAGALQKFDRAKAPNAARIAPALAAKLAAYDRSGGFGLAYAWFATGLVYDADKAPARLGAPPGSWGALFAPEQARKLFDCGIAAPDARDDLMVAAWRYAGVDPAKAAAPDIKRAVDLVLRARTGIRAFGASDIAGSLAAGSACLAMGSQGEAELATARATTSGEKRDIRFAVPREGGPMSLDALAIPRDAPNVAMAYALADFLLRPDVAARNAKAAGVSSSEIAVADELMKRLWPTGALAPNLAAFAEREWARLRAAK